MLLERLREYAEERLTDLPPPMYQLQPVRYVLVLTSDGRCLDVVDTADSSKEGRRGLRRPAPHVKRTKDVRPKALADTGVYALGFGGVGSSPERVARQHAAFVELVHRCVAATGEPSVAAVATFLDGLDVDELRLPPDFDQGATLTFRVGDVYPIDLPSVRSFWAALQAPGRDDGSTTPMTCIACGNERQVLERHPIKIRGIPGGQTLKDLISGNASAFESYGLSASQIAPTCLPCAEAYANALNALLADRDTSLWTNRAVYALWTRVEHPWNPARLLAEPQRRRPEIRGMVEARSPRSSAAATLDATAVYAVGLRASGARVVVSDWIDTTVGEAQLRMGRYFALQELVDAYGAPWEPAGLGRLLGGTVRDPRRDAVPALAIHALARLALAGTPLPLDVLYLAVRRNRAERDVSPARAMLIKMVLGSRPDRPPGGEGWMSDLEPASTEPAYLCGRLLAVLDAIQAQAIASLSASVVDRYLGAASSAPASVFDTLMPGAQAHMGKLRRDRPGVHHRLEETLETIVAPLSSFPKTLTLEQQGLFALGFYHQRASDRRAARERKEARENPKTDATVDAAVDAPAAESTDAPA